MNAMSQYFQESDHRPGHPRSSTINDRPFAALATVQRVGTDLRYHLDRSSYGNILALTRETGQYVQQIFECSMRPTSRDPSTANTKWDVNRSRRNRHLGGAAEMSQRAKMADAGRRTLQYIAENDFRTTITPCRVRRRRQEDGLAADACWPPTG